MKKLILIFTILVSFGIANAQWYYTKYGVTNINELTKEQCDLALQQANKTISFGKEMTVGGSGVLIIGGILYGSGLIKIDSSPLFSGKGVIEVVSGAFLIGVGTIITCIGVPLWISGASRKSKIEIALVKFEDTSYVPSFGLKITF